MKSELRAITWEFYRKTRWGVLGSFCAVMITLILFYDGMVYVTPFTREGLIVAYYYILIFAAIFYAAAAHFATLEETKRGSFRMRLPVRANLLIGWNLLLAAGVSASLCAITSLLFYPAIGLPVSPVGPALFCAVLTVLVAALMYTRRILIFGLSVLMFYWLGSRFGTKLFPLPLHPTHGWHLSPWDVLVLFAVGAYGAWIACTGWEKIRHGAAFDREPDAVQAQPPAILALENLKSPAAALDGFAGTRVSGAGYFVVGFGIAALLAWMVLHQGENDPFDGSLLGMCPILMITMITNFDGKRLDYCRRMALPVGERTIAWHILKPIAMQLGMLAAGYCAAMAIAWPGVSVFAPEQADRIRDLLRLHQGSLLSAVAYYLLVLSAGWVIGWVTTLVQINGSSEIGGGTVIVLCIVIVFAFLTGGMILIPIFMLSPLFSGLATVAVFTQALRKRLIGWKEILGGCIGFAVLVPILMRPFTSGGWALGVSCLAAFVVLPLAAAPLAVYYDRHR